MATAEMVKHRAKFLDKHDMTILTYLEGQRKGATTEQIIKAAAPIMRASDRNYYYYAEAYAQIRLDLLVHNGFVSRQGNLFPLFSANAEGKRALRESRRS